MYFSPSGVTRLFGIAFVLGSAVYFLVAETSVGTANIWLPWVSGVVTALIVIATVILWLKLAFIRIEERFARRQPNQRQ